MIRSIDDAGAWLEGLINVERRPDWPYARLSLAPIRALLARLGNPQDGLQVVHVGGSKGKGSTVLLAEAVLGAAGERVGTYTSPHLERWTERVRVGGREVEGDRLAAAVERVRREVEGLAATGASDLPTFFDATTAAALLCFAESGVDRALLEVGLGGRLDSTNVVVPRVACITSVELEHVDKLGPTLAAIAAEKAGILKAGVPAVAGALPPEAREVVAERARELGVPVAWAGEEFRAEVLEQGDRHLRAAVRDGEFAVEVTLPLLGAHQAANAALALACLRRAGGLSDAELAAAARAGLATAALPGRIEMLRFDPTVVVDAAHTAVSARALAAALARLPRRRTRLVLSISGGKDVEAILAALLPLADEVTVTRAEPTRSLGPAEIAAAVRARAPGLALRVVPNPHLALRAAAEGLGPGDLLCATGSVYLAGIARRVWAPPVAAALVQVSRRAPASTTAGG